MALSNSLVDWNLGGILVQGAKGFINYCTGTSPSPKYNPAFIDRLEPLSLIISLAIASLLPAKSKPSLTNHRIIWHPPMPMGTVITLDWQWLYRKGNNYLGYEISDHLIIIPKYSEAIEKALKMHISLKPDQAAKLSGLFNPAIGGLQKHLETYSGKMDGSIDKINACINLIENSQRTSQVMNLLKKSPSVKITGVTAGNSPTNSPSMTSFNTSSSFQGLKDSHKENDVFEKKSPDSSQMDSSKMKTRDTAELKIEAMPSSVSENKGSIEVDKDNVNMTNKPENSDKRKSTEIISSSPKQGIIEAKDKVINNKLEDSGKKASSEIELDKILPIIVAEQINFPEHSSEIIACMNPSSNIKLTTLDEANKMIWESQHHFIETIVNLFNEASSIPESDRGSSLKFKNCLITIDSIMNLLCSEFECLLEENSKNGLAPKI
ncbi:MAG: hypothetical protein H0W50_03355 [Parachlamydiaceae bacterium]|nr:hypothetical protein [Parachlamydiaceae bacterium]